MRKKKRSNPVWEELLERRLIGGLLANVAFNLPQKDNMDASDRKVLRELREKWDAIPRTI